MVDSQLSTRLGTPADLPVIEAMLFQAFFWSPTYERPAFEEFRPHPEFQKLMADWNRRGDRAVIAEWDGQSVGSAWTFRCCLVSPEAEGQERLNQ